MSNSLQPYRLQHTRPPCPSLFPRVFPSLCPLNQWCHPTSSSSVIPFSFCLQSFPASGSFLMSQLFTSGSQSIGASASMSIQGWFPLGFTGLISLLSKGLSRVFSSTRVLQRSGFLRVQLSYPYVTTRKTVALTIPTFVGKIISQLFNTLCSFVIAFLPRSQHLLILWLLSPTAVIWEPKKINLSLLPLFPDRPGFKSRLPCL